jgi:hypothetical protein
VATVTVRGAFDSSPSGVPGAAGAGPVSRRPSFTSRREILDLLRRFAVHLETARVLDDRAGRCRSPHLAAVLRERAETRRRMAARVRAELIRQGALDVRPRPPGTGTGRRRE